MHRSILLTYTGIFLHKELKFGGFFVNHQAIIMKLHAQTPHESRMCPIDFEVKRQGHNALITKNGLCRIIAFLYIYHHETSHTDSH